ncbi:MAG: hypothetical protein Q7J64_06375, partial [Elusimicrobiota bacterium]|nr:hypothetical protein [Elusimicrobiota bacterium]
HSGFLAAILALATASSAAPADGKASDGLVLSVMTSTQLNFGKLSIGALATRVSPYLDEKEVRQEGLHARLAISVEKDPDADREVAVVVGQTITVAGYRIKVEHINPGNRGSAVLRLWAPPPEPPKPAKKWPFSWFNFGGK